MGVAHGKAGVTNGDLEILVEAFSRRWYTSRLATVNASVGNASSRALLYWGLELKRTALPESSLGKAAAYMCKLWPGLTRFVHEVDVPVSKRGTYVVALFYTLSESAKPCGIEPKSYLRRAVRAALRGNPVPLSHEVAAEPSTADAGETQLSVA